MKILNPLLLLVPTKETTNNFDALCKVIFYRNQHINKAIETLEAFKNLLLLKMTKI